MPTQDQTPPVAQSPKKGLIYSIIGVIAVIAATVGFSMKSGNRSVTPEPVTTSSTPATDYSLPPTAYRDGTYSAEGDYTYHSGSESVTITVTLKNDIIVDTQFAGTPKAPMSGRFMSMFEEGYKALVVGKNIDEVTLTKVSGSSRTPIGFNDALAKIKAQAKI